MKKNVIIYGDITFPVQKKAIEVLSSFLLDYSGQYPICIKYGEESEDSDFRKIYIGTKENNPVIASSVEKNLNHSQEYVIKVKDDNVYIAGFDDAGVLYGCIDFYNKYILKREYPGNDDVFTKNPLDGTFENFEYSSYPAVSNRGIWTWGHVIYDYKRFLDNMLLLKMNTVIIWNDYAPINGKEIVEYAHSCGIKVIWGYSWLWATDCSDSIKAAKSCNPHDFLIKYENEYAPLGGDGIYFQSFTELNTDTVDGVVVAEAVSDFVNKTTKVFFEKYPDLEIQFGLHASSVKERLSYIQKVDPRVRIVWEDVGSYPFSYLPDDIKGFDETKELTKKIITLRGDNERFGAVTKGFTKLDWNVFEHSQGAHNIGASSEFYKEVRGLQKRKVWKYFQAHWIANAPLAYEMIRIMQNFGDGETCITALVEDGMFENDIMFPVALYSQMLWDADEDISQMIAEVALRNYVTFV